jgi:hypothetical protein
MAMHLIQLLLPLYGNDGTPLPKKQYVQLRDELIARFGGLTAYTRAPVSGLWQEDGEHTVRDDLVIYEVMADNLDVKWWSNYRTELEGRFMQDKLVIRAHEIQML